LREERAVPLVTSEVKSEGQSRQNRTLQRKGAAVKVASLAFFLQGPRKPSSLDFSPYCRCYLDYRVRVVRNQSAIANTPSQVQVLYRRARGAQATRHQSSQCMDPPRARSEKREARSWHGLTQAATSSKHAAYAHNR